MDLSWHAHHFLQLFVVTGLSSSMVKAVENVNFDEQVGNVNSKSDGLKLPENQLSQKKQSESSTQKSSD